MRSTLTYPLGSNIENLVLTGSDAINGTGNNLGNLIVGNNGNNILNGRAGADTLVGGLGNDTYYVDNIADAVTEDNAVLTEIDKVISSVSWTLGNNVERLTLTGINAINGTGNGLKNTIIGNSADNVLRGEGGSDILNGGLGNDRLVGGLGIDYFLFNTTLNSTTNKDTIVNFSVTDDTIQLSRSIFAELSLGALSASHFLESTSGSALEADDYILYNTSTGALFYDADGNGSGVATQFALLDTKPQNVSAADFVVVA